ncbi:MAG: type II toxin-antitoxin system Phd/YefM family antitoxin [Planctomycetota bacterium]|nr:type II toxin-antitoxin system Phd/YefM family antitoxin [Planctomycetota bacterium]
MAMSASEFKENIEHVLEEVLETGTPVEIELNGQTLRLAKKGGKLDNLISRPEFIQGDPEDLVHIDWSGEINGDLP